MAPITLYELYYGVYVRGLKALAVVLDNAAAHAKETGQDADAFVTAALIEDMNPLSFQVQTCSNLSKLLIKRIRGVDVGVWADDETTLAALQARVQKTLDLVQTVTAQELHGCEDEILDIPIKGTQASLKDFILMFSMPNFFFHLQTAYAILRARGVPLGKMVYISSFLEL